MYWKYYNFHDRKQGKLRHYLKYSRLLLWSASSSADPSTWHFIVRIMSISNGYNNIEKKNVEPEVFFEIPVITTSSPSMDTDSEASPIYRNITKQSIDLHSDEETDASFINNNNNSNTINRRVSFLRSLSPGNLNSSNTSRGVSAANFQFNSFPFNFRF